MTELLILARRRGSKPNTPREIIAGPSRDFVAVKAQFKSLCLARNNSEFEEIEIGTFAGERRQKLELAAQTPEPQKKRKNEKAS